MEHPVEERGEWYRTSFDELYPLLYSHRTHREAVEFLSSLSTRAPLEPGRGRILDLGCGTGRYLRAVSDQGIVVPFGLDLSAPLLAIARARLPRVPLVRGDMRRLPFRPGSFQRVLLMFTTFGYFESREEDRGVLRGIARAIEPGGSFVFDYINSRHVRENLVAASGRLIRDISVVERRWIDPAGPFLFKETRVGPMRDGGHRTYRERVRLYEPDEIEEMLAGAGLRIDLKMGDYRGREFHPRRSPRFLLVATREPGGGTPQ